MDRDSRQTLTELLVLRAQAGDTSAFTELYGLWTRELSRLAVVELGASRDADEACQDAWIAIARGLANLLDPACFARWAFRILDCRCADRLRERRVERERRAPLPEDLSAQPEQRERDDVVLLRAAIDRLDAPSRKLLHLFYDADLSVAEIAAVLAVPVGTVKSRLHAVRESLRRRLEPGDHHE